MISRNDITGDEIKSKTNNDLFREGWERIFSKKEQSSSEQKDQNQEVKDTSDKE